MLANMRDRDCRANGLDLQAIVHRDAAGSGRRSQDEVRSVKRNLMVPP
jgi:hypothetical protein